MKLKLWKSGRRGVVSVCWWSHQKASSSSELTYRLALAGRRAFLPSSHRLAPTRMQQLGSYSIGVHVAHMISANPCPAGSDTHNAQCNRCLLRSELHHVDALISQSRAIRLLAEETVETNRGGWKSAVSEWVL
jgi:hypothetical protein